VTLDADSVNSEKLKWDESMRVILAAVALSALSFVAGVAGDLSSKPTNSGASVTLRIPPPIPADAPRARPLVSTSAAIAAETPPGGRVIRTSAIVAASVPARAPAARIEAAAPARAAVHGPAKQRGERARRAAEAKPDPRLVAKGGPAKAA